MYTPIKQAADAGAKIVFVDTTLEQSDIAESKIASDNEAGGREAARALAEQMGGSGKVFVVNVKPGISTTDARAKGFEEGAKEAGLEYLGQDFSNNEPAKAASIIKAQLAKNPDLKGVFATNLFSAEGTANGVREAGKGGDVKIVGFDAGPAQVEQLEKGDVQALVAQKPADIGAQGVEQAVKALNGEPTEPEIGTESVTITKRTSPTARTRCTSPAASPPRRADPGSPRKAVVVTHGGREVAVAQAHGRSPTRSIQARRRRWRRSSVMRS
jgi:ribose transport system substrate-binding protein